MHAHGPPRAPTRLRSKSGSALVLAILLSASATLNVAAHGAEDQPKPFVEAGPGPSHVLGAEAASPVDTLRTEGGDWWVPSHLLDYALVAGGTAGYIVGRRLPPRSEPLWGPAYDPADPATVFEAEGIQRRFRERDGEVTVPRRWIHILLAGAGVFVTGLEGADLVRGDGSLHRVHETAVGYAETVALTAATTALTKPAVGRLRPDFGDRARRYHCHGDPEAFGDACGPGVTALSDDPDEADDLLDDGRRSFFSGHAAHAFNLFGYAGLVVGGRYVWGDDASVRSRRVGLAGQAAMMGAASWIAGTRISDRRHHMSDVAVGTLVGLGLANLSYWRRFQRDGSLRASSGNPEDGRIGMFPWVVPPAAGIRVEVRTR